MGKSERAHLSENRGDDNSKQGGPISSKSNLIETKLLEDEESETEKEANSDNTMEEYQQVFRKVVLDGKLKEVHSQVYKNKDILCLELYEFVRATPEELEELESDSLDESLGNKQLAIAEPEEDEHKYDAEVKNTISIA